MELKAIEINNHHCTKKKKKMKNPTTSNNLDTRHHKGWNQLDAPSHAASVGTDKVKSGEHALPRPPKKPGGIHGTKLTMFLLYAWTGYLLCKIMMEVIKRRRLLKSNEAFNKMGSIIPQNQRSISDTNNEKLKKSIPNDGGGTITAKTKGTRTTTSTDTRLGAGETQWVNTRQWENSDGITNATIGEIREAIDDEFNYNVRRLVLNKHSGPRMTVQPQK